MPSVEENYRLLWSIICQQMKNGQLEGVDWSDVAQQLGLDKPATANMRYARFKAELNKLGFPNTSKSDTKGGPKATPTKTANPKARSAVTKSKTPTKGKGKKGKASVKDEDHEDESGMGRATESGVDMLAENGGKGYQEMDLQEEAEEEDA